MHSIDYYERSLFSSVEGWVDQNKDYTDEQRKAHYGHVITLLGAAKQVELMKSPKVAAGYDEYIELINQAQTANMEMIDYLGNNEHTNNILDSVGEAGELSFQYSQMVGEVIFGIGVFGQTISLAETIIHYGNYFDKIENTLGDLIYTAAQETEKSYCRNSMPCFGSKTAWREYTVDENIYYIPQEVDDRLSYIQNRIDEVEEKYRNPQLIKPNTHSDYQAILNESTGTASVDLTEETVIISHPPKVILASAGKYFEVGHTIRFDASDSYDSDGDTLQYTWKLFSPSGSNATLTPVNVNQQEFIADIAGSYTVVLQASDGIHLTQNSLSVYVKPQKITEPEEIIESEATCEVGGEQPELIEGQLTCGLSGKSESQTYFDFDLPGNVEKLTVWLSGKSKQTAKAADIHFSYGVKPEVIWGADKIGQRRVFITADNSSATDKINETIEIISPKAGKYWLLLFAFMEDFSNVSLFYQLTLGVLDSDKDGVLDSQDQYPNDPLEWADTDGDGVADNEDSFPNDAAASTDTDQDGYPDSWNAGYTSDNSETGLIQDEVPNDATQSLSDNGLIPFFKDKAGFSLTANTLYLPNVKVNGQGSYEAYFKYDGASLTLIKINPIESTNNSVAEFDPSSGLLTISSIELLDSLSLNGQVKAILKYVNDSNPIRFDVVELGGAGEQAVIDPLLAAEDKKITLVAAWEYTGKYDYCDSYAKGVLDIRVSTIQWLGQEWHHDCRVTNGIFDGIFPAEFGSPLAEREFETLIQGFYDAFFGVSAFEIKVLHFELTEIIFTVNDSRDGSVEIVTLNR